MLILISMVTVASGLLISVTLCFQCFQSLVLPWQLTIIQPVDIYPSIDRLWKQLDKKWFCIDLSCSHSYVFINVLATWTTWGSTFSLKRKSVFALCYLQWPPLESRNNFLCEYLWNYYSYQLQNLDSFCVSTGDDASVYFQSTANLTNVSILCRVRITISR